MSESSASPAGAPRLSSVGSARVSSGDDADPGVGPTDGQAEHLASFGAWLRRWRRALDLTRADLAARLPCAEITLRKIETDERRPSEQMAELLADKLGIGRDLRPLFVDCARGRRSAARLPTPPQRVASSGPLPTQPRARVELTVPRTPLIGRAREVAEVIRLLRRPEVRLLTLTGAGGIGKTRLAQQVALDLVERFVDGVVFVPLASIRDPALALSAVARALDVAETGRAPLAAILTEHLRARSFLLVLDNFEQVVAAGPDVAELVTGCPHLKVLVTSRTALRVYGEQELAVPPLDVPGPARAMSLEELREYPAMQLFAARARAVRSDFRLTRENAHTIAAICARLDGLPLGIELAAARVKVLSPAALLGRLGRRLDMLTAGALDLPPRQQTLRAAIGWSFDLLAEPERAIFRRLGVFAGGFALDDTEAVVGDPEQPDTVLDRVTSLVDQSLLMHDPADAGGERLVMLETIREFALEHLVASGEEDAVRRRHAAHYLALAERAEPELTGRDQAAWMVRLERAHADLRAALAWLLGRSAVEPSLRLAGALWRFWMVRGHFHEGRDRLVAAVSLPTDGECSAGRAKALLGAGMLSHYRGDRAGARAYLEQSQRAFERLGDARGAATTLVGLGILDHAGGAFETARGRFEESLAMQLAAGDERGAATSLLNLGRTLSAQGDHGGARRRYEDALEILRRLGDRYTISNLLNNLGYVAFCQDDYARARDYYGESLAIRRTLRFKYGIAHSLNNLAGVGLALGEYQRARARYTKSLLMFEQLGDRKGVAEVLEGFASLAAVERQWERAVTLASAAVALRQEIGAPLSPDGAARWERSLLPARAALTDRERETAEAAGRAMPSVAIAYAIGRVDRYGELDRGRSAQPDEPTGRSDDCSAPVSRR